VTGPNEVRAIEAAKMQQIMKKSSKKIGCFKSMKNLGRENLHDFLSKNAGTHEIRNGRNFIFMMKTLYKDLKIRFDIDRQIMNISSLLRAMLLWVVFSNSSGASSST
jgi:hypothetical protein